MLDDRQRPRDHRRARPHARSLALALALAGGCGDDGGASASAGTETTGASATTDGTAATTSAGATTTTTGSTGASTSATATTSTTSATATTNTESTTAEPPAADYVLFAPMGGQITYLMDREGQQVHAWNTSTPPGMTSYLLAGGDLVRAGVTGGAAFNAAGAGGRIERLTWEGATVWSIDYASMAHRQHHDIEPLPSGNILAIAWERISPADAIAHGRAPATVDMSRGLWPDTIVELRPSDGAVVWEWHAWDHLIQDHDPNAADFGAPEDYPERIDLNFTQSNGVLADWLHVNAVDYHPELDQVLISAHNFSEIWIIDHGTTSAEAAGHSGGARGRGGDLLYRWGNPAAYRSGEAADRQLYRQHDARWIDGALAEAGNITIFNNGAMPDHPYSSVLEVSPPLADDGAYTFAGGVYGPAAPTWEYVADPPESLYSANMSGAERLPNGDTMICDGPSGRFFAVDAGGAITWEYVYGDNVFRVGPYAADDPALAGRDLTPSGPIPAP